MSGPLTRAAEDLCITPQGMRAAISRSMHDHARNKNTIAYYCHQTAQQQGLNGEDSMTLIAFQALCLVEVLERQVLDFVNTSLNPPSLFRQEDLKPGEFRQVKP